jgi:hypothetical protein
MENDKPEYGHTFEFTVRSRGSYTVGDGPATDADEFSGHGHVVRVRAWSLREACRAAMNVPLPKWDMVDAEDWDEPER